MLTSNNQTFVDFMLPEDKLIVTEKELVTEEVDEEVEI